MALEAVFSAICPEISYLNYRKIEKSLIKTSEYSLSEYYGNKKIFNVQLVPIQPLVDFLIENKIVNTEKFSTENINKAIRNKL